MKENKVKKFWDEHKKEVALAVGAVAIGTVGVIVGHKLGYARSCRDCVETLNKAGLGGFVYSLKGMGGSPIYNQYNEGAFKPDQLGELGKAIAENVSEWSDAEFTHFIAIGKKVET